MKVTALRGVVIARYVLVIVICQKQLNNSLIRFNSSTKQGHYLMIMPIEILIINTLEREKLIFLGTKALCFADGTMSLDFFYLFFDETEIHW